MDRITESDQTNESDSMQKTVSNEVKADNNEISEINFEECKKSESLAQNEEIPKEIDYSKCLKNSESSYIEKNDFNSDTEVENLNPKDSEVENPKSKEIEEENLKSKDSEVENLKSKETEVGNLESIDLDSDLECSNLNEASILKKGYVAELNRTRDQISHIEQQDKRILEMMDGIEFGSEQFKERLNIHNQIMETKNLLIANEEQLSKKLETINQKCLDYVDEDLSDGRQASIEANSVINSSELLESQFDELYYQNKIDKKGLLELHEVNNENIRSMFSLKQDIQSAMEAKQFQIDEYIYGHNMTPFQTRHDQYLLQLEKEYKDFSDAHSKLDYHIARLDENNIKIAEYSDFEYDSVVYKKKTTILETAKGEDDPEKTNYFKDEILAKDCLESFEPSHWEKLSLDEKKYSMERLTDYNSEILSINHIPKIEYYNIDDDGDYGRFSKQENTLYINIHNIEDPYETIDTISHECRHCYQYERADKLVNERDYEFKNSFENYIYPEDDYFAYCSQLVEADAQKYANRIKKYALSMMKK